MALPILAGLFSFLAGWAARILGSGFVRIAIWKSLIWVLCVSIFPILLYNVLSDLIVEFFGIVSTVASNEGVQPFIVSFSGMAGWLLVTCKVPEALSLIISAHIFRLAISLIPFVGKAY